MHAVCFQDLQIYVFINIMIIIVQSQIYPKWQLYDQLIMCGLLMSNMFIHKCFSYEMHVISAVETATNSSSS